MEKSLIPGCLLPGRHPPQIRYQGNPKRPVYAVYYVLSKNSMPDWIADNYERYPHWSGERTWIYVRRCRIALTPSRSRPFYVVF